jgi:hypothetical protein
MTMMGRRTMMRSACHRLRGDSFRTVSSRFRIAGRLLYAACRCLSLGRRLRRLLTGCVCTSRRLIGAVRCVDGALRWIGLVRRTSREQRKGQHRPGKSNQF